MEQNEIIAAIGVIVTLILAIFGWVKYIITGIQKDHDEHVRRVAKVSEAANEALMKVDRVSEAQAIHTAKLDTKLDSLGAQLTQFTTQYGFVLEIFTNRIKKSFEQDDTHV